MVYRLDRFTPKGKLSVLAAALGFLSFVLPWAEFTATNGIAVSSFESPASLLLAFFFPGPVTPTTNTALLEWAQAAAYGFAVWTIGAALFFVSCLLVLAQAFGPFRWGGVFMLAAAVFSTVGILSFSKTFSYGLNLWATVGPSPVGVGLGFFASLLAFVPMVRVDVRDRWVRDPEGHGWTAPAGRGARRGFLSRNPASPSTGAAPFPTPSMNSGVPAGSPSPIILNAGAPPRRFCPECGAWYLDGEVTCPREGASLKPVSEPPASRGPN